MESRLGQNPVLELRPPHVHGTLASVKPSDAAELQIERYRAMTGEERLAIALRLHEFSCNLAREGIKAQHPHATAATIEKLLHERLKVGRGA